MDDERTVDPNALRTRAAHVAASLKSKFYNSPEYREIEHQFARLVAEKRALPSTPPYPEMKGLAVVGGSGAGKSRSLAKVFEVHGRGQGACDDKGGLKILSLRTPSPAGLKFLGLEALNALDYSITRPTATGTHIWKMVREQLSGQRVDVLHIDEAQDILRFNTSTEMGHVVNTLKSLSQDANWPLILVLSGTRELAELINSDQQLARRLRTVGFERISITSHGHRIVKVIMDYSDEAQLSVAVEVCVEDLILRLIHGASHQFGIAVEIIIEAIGVAIEQGHKTLDVLAFASAYRNRYGGRDYCNVFLCASLDDTDPGMALGQTGLPDDQGRLKRRSSGRNKSQR